MAGLFCIPKHLVDKLKSSAIKGEVNVKELYEMSSQERRAFFEKHTDRELGEFINTKFEEAMVSRQKDAMLSWAQSVFTPEAKEKPVYKTVLDKINTLDDMGVLSPKTERAFLEDLVADKLGVRVTPAEVRAISERAAKIQEAQEKLGDDLGNPSKMAENLAFFKAKKAMDDYLASLTPAPQLRVITGTIGRGMMLASIKSPILNIGSNLEIGFAEAFGRRMSAGKIRGADNKLAREYVSMVRKIYKATGYDVSRMRSLRDTGASGGRVLGEDMVHTEGPGAVRKIGRIVEDVVFKNLMGAPDSAFASIHFADSVNLNARRMAKDPAEARALMNDAMRIKPQTAKGELLREQAIQDAEYATWTNQSWATRFSEGTRKILNDLTGDLRVGDYVFPFVRTPSNVVAAGLDYAGLGAPKALMKTYKAFKTGDLKSKEYISAVTRDLTRAGLGMVGALVITNMLENEDFVGAYDPRRKQIEQLRNSRDNSIRIGGKWISVDWLGPLAVPVTAIMYARSYGDNPKEKTYQYALGMGSAITSLPVIEEITGWLKEYEYNKNQTFEEMTDASKEYAINELRARLIPSIFADVAKAIDPKVRDTTGLSGFKKVAASMPFLSEELPVKRNIFGEEIIGEPGWSDILFGARVRTDKETPLVAELSRVSEAVDKGLTFTDWRTSSTKKLAQFRQTVGSEKYEEATIRYGEVLRESLEKTIADPKYADLTDEQKFTIISGKDTDAMETVFKEYRFKYKQEKSEKLPKI